MEITIVVMLNFKKIIAKNVTKMITELYWLISLDSIVIVLPVILKFPKLVNNAIILGNILISN